MTNDQLKQEYLYCKYCLNEIEEAKGITSHADDIYHPECFELLTHFYDYDEFKEEFKD